MSVEISFSNLHVPTQDLDRSLPVSSLDNEPTGHLHGRLSIAIGGRELPSMGYWGPDDVCIETWAEQLGLIVQALSNCPISEYTFDEGEEGQPAFRFVRNHDKVFVSVVDAEFSGGMGDPDWQDVPCSFEELALEAREFHRALYSELKLQAPKGADAWWVHHLRSIGLPNEARG